MRFPSDENTAKIFVEPVRSNRPTFDDGEVLLSIPMRSVWRDMLALLWIVVVAFIGFMAAAMVMGCKDDEKRELDRPHMHLVYDGWVFSEYRDDEHHVTCWKTYHGLSCLRDEAPSK